MKYKIVVGGTLPGLNEYIAAERTNRYMAAALKRQCEAVVMHGARTLGKLRIICPVYMQYTWYERDKRRDKDNVSSFGRKVIQDALVKTHILQGDGWAAIDGFEDRFSVDRAHPRIEVVIYEREK